ncbi:uncharacterized protein LOC123530056 [Mercenaria mercenaria]|uniref:uncharacterized protein LOC123530056 n=1 Tax=Mercenaria mercenaria TaxID=6596 RepID=UPI00234E683C|nr:uncharacterized protein LOC123530056 [Mercenaria mercenaria]
MDVKVCSILFVFFQISAALRVLVTKEQCGRSFDLTAEKEVYLDYEGAELWNDSSTCVINITTSDIDEMICIKSDRRVLIDMKCSWTLSYYVEGYHRYSYYPPNQYSCSDFNMRPLCKRSRVTSVVYRDNFLFDNAHVKVNVRLYTKKYIPTTTRRIYTSKPWSSWTSGSSGYDDDDDPASRKAKTGTVVTIVLGSLLAVVLVTVCVYLMSGKCSSTKPQDGAPPVVQYLSTAQQENQYANQTENTASNEDGPQQFPLNPSDFHPHQQYTPDPSHNAGDTGGQKLDLPPPAYDTLPSAPPPPYPGY